MHQLANKEHPGGENVRRNLKKTVNPADKEERSGGSLLHARSVARGSIELGVLIMGRGRRRQVKVAKKEKGTSQRLTHGAQRKGAYYYKGGHENK